MSEPTTGMLGVSIDEHERRLDGHDDDFKEHAEWIRKIQSRPPLWVGFLITLLVGVICAGASAIITQALGG